MVTKGGIFRTIDRCLSVTSRNVLSMSHCFDFDKTSYTWHYNPNVSTVIAKFEIDNSVSFTYKNSVKSNIFLFSI